MPDGGVPEVMRSPPPNRGPGPAQGWGYSQSLAKRTLLENARPLRANDDKKCREPKSTQEYPCKVTAKEQQVSRRPQGYSWKTRGALHPRADCILGRRRRYKTLPKLMRHNMIMATRILGNELRSVEAFRPLPLHPHPAKGGRGHGPDWHQKRF